MRQRPSVVQEMDRGHGAGDGSQPVPDLRVEFSNLDGWRVLIRSERARSWARNSLRSAAHRHHGTEIRTSFAGVNEIVGKARREGYVSEYVGPYETVRF